MSTTPPRVVIVGRPNVGKSRLFNRLVGQRRALVHDQPGVTRDWTNIEVTLEESLVELVDTGGLDLSADGLFAAETRQMALEQLSDADLLLLVVDGSDGPTAGDEEIVSLLRRLSTPRLLIVNKGDRRDAIEQLLEFHSLGLGEPLLVSAEHGLGFGDMVEEIVRALPAEGRAARPVETGRRVALVGRPNVGKSSLLNKLVGKDRMIVSSTPGTTRDSVDTIVKVEGTSWVLVDTAGIRKRTRTAEAPDVLATILAEKSLQRSDVALLMLDASQGPTTGDAVIAGKIVQARRPAVILANKWDLRTGDDPEEFRQLVRDNLHMLDWAEILLVSALTGKRTGGVWDAANRALSAWETRLGTSELNKWVSEVISKGPTLTVGGRRAKLRYVAQVAVAPPTLVLFVNRKGKVPKPWMRYFENRLRELFPFTGTPIRLRVVTEERRRRPGT